MKSLILQALDKLEIGEYRIVEKNRKSAELFFIKKTLDMKRAKNVTTYDVTVFVDFEKNDKKCKGQAAVSVFPGMTFDEIVRTLESAKLAASYVANPAYTLPGPELNAKLATDFGLEDDGNAFIEMKSNLLEHSMEDDCRIMAEALFAEDTCEDVWLNSAELFIYDTTVHILTSNGIDAGYRKARVWGEFVAQCKEPQDVETYKSFEYDALDTEALKAKVKKTLEYTRARAQARKAPASGNYRVILSDEYMSTLFEFYSGKADASYIYAGYSNYEKGKDVQKSEGHETVSGDRLSVTYKASTPYSSEGIRLCDRELIADGILKTVTGSARFASYLGIEPTGEFNAVKVACGSTSVEEMKRKPYLHVVNFSDFQMDDFTGHFGGEIRLAFLYDGETVIPVTGGSVNGNWFDVQGRLTLSSESVIEKGYEGPLAVCMEDIPVAGE